MYNLIADEPAPAPPESCAMLKALYLEAARLFAEEFKLDGELKVVLFTRDKKVAVTNGTTVKSYTFEELV